MNKDTALHNFWASFGLKAYEETHVEDDAQLPYITHEGAVDNFGNEIAQSASLWYRSTTWADITAKRDEIAERITRGGVYVHYDGGALLIRMGNPFAQRMADPNDDMVRRILINYTVEYLD